MLSYWFFTKATHWTALHIVRTSQLREWLDDVPVVFLPPVDKFHFDLNFLNRGTSIPVVTLAVLRTSDLNAQKCLEMTAALRSLLLAILSIGCIRSAGLPSTTPFSKCIPLALNNCPMLPVKMIIQQAIDAVGHDAPMQMQVRSFS
uniref:Uncharacterized protein n=1 Tax=Steinernema glaseri TaxID=37863 RepID=A0A1I8A979_9BILA